MSLTARLCMNCNGRGSVKVLDAHGHDTGRNRDCSYCEGCGEVIAYAAYREAVEALQKIADPECMVRGTGGWIDTEAPARIAENALDYKPKGIR